MLHFGSNEPHKKKVVQTCFTLEVIGMSIYAKNGWTWHNKFYNYGAAWRRSSKETNNKRRTKPGTVVL
jgi:hypothetical protein